MHNRYVNIRATIYNILNDQTVLLLKNTFTPPTTSDQQKFQWASSITVDTILVIDQLLLSSGLCGCIIDLNIMQKDRDQAVTAPPLHYRGAILFLDLMQ